MTALLPFLKMHGLGNDFVVLDGRVQPVTLSPERAQAIADRRRGVGCDQILVLEPARGQGDVFMRILNADGSQVGACGNGTRCVARLIFEETGRDTAAVETEAGLLRAARAGDGLVTVDMGPAHLDWHAIPLAHPGDTRHLDLSVGPPEAGLADPCAVGLGNPHVLFFVDDAEAVDLATHGPQVEHDPLFPERVNVGVVQVLDAGHVRYRVWERGVGITAACGSGACAAAVASARRRLTGRQVRVTLDGGDLWIDWREDGTDANRVLMTGPASKSFEGTLAAELLR